MLKHDPGHPIYGPLLNVCMDRDVYRGLARAWRGSEAGRRLLAERPVAVLAEHLCAPA